MALASATVTVVLNLDPVQATQAFGISDPEIDGRRCFATLDGGSQGVDYQIRWTAADTSGQTWNRTVLLQCAETS